MSNFTHYLNYLLEKEPQDEEIKLTKLCMDIINLYENEDVLTEIQNEINHTTNAFVKLLAVLCVLIIRLNDSLKLGNNDEIQRFRNQIKLVQDRLAKMS